MATTLLFAILFCLFVPLTTLSLTWVGEFGGAAWGGIILLNLASLNAVRGAVVKGMATNDELLTAMAHVFAMITLFFAYPIYTLGFTLPWLGFIGNFMNCAASVYVAYVLGRLSVMAGVFLYPIGYWSVVANVYIVVRLHEEQVLVR